MIVVPSEAVYLPKFTYLWTLGIGRFPDALLKKGNRDAAVREIARCFLAGAGMTIPGELARVTGLSRPEAGRGNRALVAEGYATMPATGTYVVASPHRAVQMRLTTHPQRAHPSGRCLRQLVTPTSSARADA